MIDKLKETMIEISDNKILLEDKTEFEQMEILSSVINKNVDEKIKSIIFSDELTKVGNRKKLEKIFKKLSKKEINFALNNFKAINDVFGHNLGDEYLKFFANSIVSLMGDKGELIRYSGDEFIFIYKNYINKQELNNFYNENVLPFF